MNRARTFSSLTLAVGSLVLLGSICAPPAYAQNIQALFTFACDSTVKTCSNGEFPNSLIQSADGNFYGTTLFKGTGNNAAGTVFKITPAGHFTTLHTFVADQNGKYPGGESPNSLVEGNDGFLYGTASGGPNGNFGNGIVFKLSKAGAGFQILHSFCPATNCSDSTGPYGLLLGLDGNFYGASMGVTWRMTPKGSFTVLHTFNKLVEGPCAQGMVQASDGNFYGTSIGGETVLTALFQLTPAGQFTVLQTLHYGQFPVSAPIQASDGKIYGGLARFEGQASPGMFESGFSGTDFTQILLPSPLGFGDHVSSMASGSDGNIWGTVTSVGGDFPNDAIVQIPLSGSPLKTFAFDGSNGTLPNAPPIQASDGRFFGITLFGGSVPQGDTAQGVVFALDAGLAPPKASIQSFGPSQGSVGTTVTIHGSHFIGTSTVTFGGVSAKFRVLNTGNIRAIVPAGASTGAITVTNKGGAAVSTTNFTVQ